MKIGIFGTRGVPARYGGFETFAEELGKRLVERGHDVTVYGRESFLGYFSRVLSGKATGWYEGIRQRWAPTFFHKYAETPLHALTTGIVSFFESYDCVLLCNAANSPFAWLIRAAGKPLAINVDGIERERAKWNALGKLWYKLGERSSVWWASEIVSDAEVIRSYYQSQFGVESTVLAYGTRVTVRPPGEVVKKFSLVPRQYLLYVSRFEPENNALGVIQAYNASGISLPLVMVGDAPYAEAYKESLRAHASSGVIFTGYQFGEAYEELQSNALLYIQATEVGGTHPALVEAMGYGNCIIANDTPEHREVLQDCGQYYAKNDFGQLAQLLQETVSNPTMVASFREKALARARATYDWEVITSQYEELFKKLCK